MLAADADPLTVKKVRSIARMLNTVSDLRSMIVSFLFAMSSSTAIIDSRWELPLAAYCRKVPSFFSALHPTFLRLQTDTRIASLLPTLVSVFLEVSPLQESVPDKRPIMLGFIPDFLQNKCLIFGEQVPENE